jgi:hypothetical protein
VLDGKKKLTSQTARSLNLVVRKKNRTVEYTPPSEVKAEAENRKDLLIKTNENRIPVEEIGVIKTKYRTIR